MNNFLVTLQALDIILFIKVALLIIFGLYAIFAFMIFNQVRSFNNVIFLTSNKSTLLQLLTFIYFLACISLFLLTLVIV